MIYRSIALNNDINVRHEPSTCPNCNREIMPNYHHAFKWITEENVVWVTASCTAADCGRPFFLAALYYEEPMGNGSYRIGFKDTQVVMLPVLIKPAIEFSNLPLRSFYKNFLVIYNQAEHANKLGLNEIDGIAYRKSLEYLLKDYAIYSHPEDTDKIAENPSISQVIKKYYSEIGTLADVAERASWLGNDAAHYVKKWVSKDVDDLKLAIGLTVHWIEQSEKSKKLLTDMPKLSRS